MTQFCILCVMVIGMMWHHPASECHDPPQIRNGIYPVLEQYSDTTDLPEGKMLIRFHHAFLDSNTANQPFYLQIDTSDFVPLSLAEEPKGVKQADERTLLMLTLTEQSGEQLSRFTERHLNGRVAIVIGGHAVTLHKVRSRIDGGHLQITRCTDDACRYLLMELQK